MQTILRYMQNMQMYAKHSNNLQLYTKKIIYVQIRAKYANYAIVCIKGKYTEQQKKRRIFENCVNYPYCELMY